MDLLTAQIKLAGVDIPAFFPEGSRKEELQWSLNQLDGLPDTVWPILVITSYSIHYTKLYDIRFSLVDPQQARYGQLFDINKAVTQALYQRLQNQRQTFVTQRWLDANLGLPPQFFAQGDVRITPQRNNFV